MAIRYTYNEYKDFPEATEISESRERGKICFSAIALVLLIASFISLFIDFSGTWPMIFVAAGSIIFFVHLFTKYDEITDRKINKAIDKRKKMLKDIAESKYSCKHIKVLDERKFGKCLICKQSDKDLTLCEIKNDIGTRKIFICDDCQSKF
jgi:hypothetical protein